MNRDPFRLQTDHNWSCLRKSFSHSCVRALKKTARENTVILRSPHEKIPSLLFPSQHFKKNSILPPTISFPYPYLHLHLSLSFLSHSGRQTRLGSARTTYGEGAGPRPPPPTRWLGSGGAAPLRCLPATRIQRQRPSPALRRLDPVAPLSRPIPRDGDDNDKEVAGIRRHGASLPLPVARRLSAARIRRRRPSPALRRPDPAVQPLSHAMATTTTRRWPGSSGTAPLPVVRW